MKDCRSCAGNRTCDHHNFGWEICNNWQPVIVHCKDCKWYRGETHWCDMNSKDRAEHYNWYADDFCSYGERRSDD